MEQKEQGIIRDRYELIFKELQNLLAFGYLCVIILGMIFEAGYYFSFGINIFEYAGISDFLMAPFRRPISLVILLFIGIYLLITYPIDQWMAKKWPRFYRILNFGLVRADNSTLYRNIMFGITGLVLIIMFSFKAGATAFKDIKASETTTIHLRFTENEEDIFGKKVGQTSSFIFLLDTANQLQVIPIHAQVLSVEPLLPQESSD